MNGVTGVGRGWYKGLTVGVTALSTVSMAAPPLAATLPQEPVIEQTLEQKDPVVSYPSFPKTPVIPQPLKLKEEVRRLQTIEQHELLWLVEPLLKARAAYNLTGDADYLNPYLAYRSAIRSNPKKLAQFEALVQSFQTRAKMRVSLPVDCSPDYPGANCAPETFPADPSTQYITAATVMGLFHNRPLLIDKVLDRFLKLDITWVRPEVIPGYGGGYYPFNSIRYNIYNFWYEVREQDKSYDIINHEIIHAVDGERMFFSYFPDGFLSEMTPLELDQFQTIRKSLFQEHEEYPLKGTLRDYTYKNEQEFLAETVGVFYKKPEVLFKNSPQLYNLYRDFFKLDPLNNYQDLS